MWSIVGRHVNGFLDVSVEIVFCFSLSALCLVYILNEWLLLFYEIACLFWLLDALNAQLSSFPNDCMYNNIFLLQALYAFHNLAVAFPFMFYLRLH